MTDARSWVTAAVGEGSVVVRSRRLPGATSSVVRALDVIGRRGTRHRLVLRSYEDREPQTVEPRAVEREVAALAVAARTGLSVPEVVASDVEAGRVLMTRLPGRPTMSGGPDWLPRLAQTLLAADSVAAPSGMDSYEHWYAIDEGVPSWSRRDASWRRALEHLAAARLPQAPSRFIHRDFHPANVLWSRGRITGVVDWVNGCRGPIEADIAITRVNLALVAGAAAADAFLTACGYEIAAGYDPVWDLTVACSMTDPGSVLALGVFGALLTVDSVCRTLDDVVARAVSNLR